MKCLPLLLLLATLVAAIPHRADIRRVAYIPEDEFRGPVPRSVPTPHPQPPAPRPVPSTPNAPKPHASKPHASKPHASKPHGSEPHASKPHTSKPHASKPHASKPHGSKPHGSKPHGSKPHEPHGSKPHASKPHGSKPHGSKPHGSKPHGSKPHGSKPHASELPGSKPHGSEPHGPHGSKPHGSQPQGSEPHASKPHASKPHASKPHASKPPGSKPHGSKPPVAAPPSATNSSKCPAFPGMSTTLPGAKHSYCCTAAKPCGKPQAADAKATYFSMGHEPGACGQTFPDSAHYIAVNSAIMGSLSSGTKKNPLCGRKVTVKNAQTGKTATGFVADKCPGCKTSYGIDLSPSLFTQLASKSQGVFSVEWWFE